jgi:hypothetical protein
MVLLLTEPVAVSDLFHDKALALYVKLNSVITRANSIPSGKAMPQRLRSTNVRPFIQSRHDPQDTPMNRTRQLFRLPQRLGRDDDLHDCYMIGHIDGKVNVIDIKRSLVSVPHWVPPSDPFQISDFSPPSPPTALPNICQLKPVPPINRISAPFHPHLPDQAG